jgi:uncharacterized membrane protein YcaP (DUF421 family)
MESVLRGASIYFVLMVVLRFSGRRTLSQMTPFDFVLVLIVAETTQQALLGDDFSIVNAVILILTLFSIDILLSHVKQGLPRVGRWIDGAPTVLISDGRLEVEAMSRARVDLTDVLEAARAQQGLERLDESRSAVLEIGGSISIIPKEK